MGLATHFRFSPVFGFDVSLSLCIGKCTSPATTMVVCFFRGSFPGPHSEPDFLSFPLRFFWRSSAVRILTRDEDRLLSAAALGSSFPCFQLFSSSLLLFPFPPRTVSSPLELFLFPGDNFLFGDEWLRPAPQCAFFLGQCSLRPMGIPNPASFLTGVFLLFFFPWHS